MPTEPPLTQLWETVEHRDSTCAGWIGKMRHVTGGWAAAHGSWLMGCSPHAPGFGRDGLRDMNHGRWPVLLPWRLPGRRLPDLTANVVNSSLAARLPRCWAPLSWQVDLWQVSTQPLLGVAAQQQFLPTKIPPKRRWVTTPIVLHPSPTLPPLGINTERHVNLSVGDWFPQPWSLNPFQCRSSHHK